jgi:hypothetical protein
VVQDVDEVPERCDTCGSAAFRPASRPERLRAWFDHGQGAGAWWYCTGCGAAWSGGSRYVLLGHRSRRARWVRLPWDLLEALRAARHWHPVPRFYAAVGLVALVPAALIAVLVRPRWWAALSGIPLGAVVVAFLWSLTSGLGPAARRDVLMQVAPRRAWAREIEEDLVDLRREAHRFPLLAPEGWDGELSLAGSGWRVPRRGPRQLVEVTVVADRGDPALDPDRHSPGWRPAAPRVEVRATREPFGVPDEQAVGDLVDRAWPPRSWGPGDDELEPLDRQEVRRRLVADARQHDRERDRRARELSSGWRTGTVLVDGVSVPARLLSHGEAAVATFTLDEAKILVSADGVAVEALRLTRITDPVPLLEQQATRRRRMLLGEEATA